MLKTTIKTGLMVLALFLTTVLSTTAYSQNFTASYNYGYQPMPNAFAYAPGYVWEERVGSGYVVSESDESAANVMDKSYYAKLPGYDPYYTYMSAGEMNEGASAADAATALTSTNEGVPAVSAKDNSALMVTYHPYVRPTDKKVSDDAMVFMPTSTPVANDKTGIFAAPHGYKFYNDKNSSASEIKKNVPIRDFRAGYWQNKYYRDEFHNQKSYNETYGQYNYWNEGTWNSASEK